MNGCVQVLLVSMMPGTLVVDEDEIVEKENVSGIAYSRDDAKITLRRVPDRPGIAAAVFGALSEHNVNVDMIVQNVSADGMTDMTFTVGKADLPRARATLAEAQPQIGSEVWRIPMWQRSAWWAWACAATPASAFVFAPPSRQGDQHSGHHQ